VEIIEELDGDLVLRRATAADTEALATFNAEMHREPDEDISAEIAAWVRDLMDGGHPTTAAGDFTVVEDRTSGQIVSSASLIPQTWAYGGIPFGVGRIELVGTRPDYRRRGLVRRQMAVIHRWSADRGHILQAISGIPHYYRRFGYEMALDLGATRVGFRPHVPDLAAESEEPFRLRPATATDLPFIAAVDEEARRRWLVAAVRDETQWRYELDGRRDEKQLAHRIIEAPDGRPVGYLVHVDELWGKNVVVFAYELVQGTSWLAVTPTVLRYLRTSGEGYQARPGSRPWDGIAFALGTEHPVYRAIPDRLPRIARPYAWYLRLPEIAAFLRQVAPVLEGRLAASAAAGHSGDLRIGFYGAGLRLTLAQGQIEAVDAWEPDDWESDPAFPGLTFLQLLFGYRSLAELEYAFADCRANGEAARVLLDALFPKQPSHVWPLE
jgi:hypothetical protein